MYTVAFIVSTVGFHWEEVFDPYREIKEAGWHAAFYTVNGKAPVADPNSVKLRPILSFIGLGTRSDFSPESSLGKELQTKLSSAEAVSELDVTRVDAIYIPGGHGCLFDVNTNETVHEKIRQAYDENKIIAAVCHGSSCLAFVRKQDGAAIIKDKKVTGFPDIEDTALIKLGLVDQRFLPLPYKNEEKMKEAGARITPIDTAMAILNPMHHVTDLPFVTGVGPKSAAMVAKKIVKIAQDRGLS